MKNEVTLLINGLAGGGAEAVCVTIANELCQRGWHVSIVIVNLNDEKYINRVDINVNVINLDADKTRSAIKPLFSYLFKSKPKKILVFTYELTVLVVLWRFLFRRNSKIITRNINSISRIRKMKVSLWQKIVVRPLIDLTYKKSDIIINQCDGMEKDLLDFYPDIKNNSVVINNPVNKHAEDFVFDCSFFDPSIDKPYFLMVGRLDDQKGYEYAIRAFANFLVSNPDVDLRILGVGPILSDLKELCDELKICNRVYFMGFRDDVYQLYFNAIATLLTSKFEGFPNVLIESITIGTPVVAFDCVSGPSEIILSGENGYLVELFNIDDFVSAMKNIYLTPLSRDGIRNTSKRYGFKAIMDKYDNLLTNA